MPHRILELPEAATAAASACLDASREAPVVIFKKSLICPVSHHALSEFHAFLEAYAGPTVLQVAEVDVLAARPLARGLVRELGIEHQSPQALLFAGGELRWHASHSELTREAFADQLAASGD